MTLRLHKVVLLLVIFVFVAPNAFAQTRETKDAHATLRRYIDLRLNWADWNVYSKFINWPDEPGWDCWWLAKGYRIGPASKDSKRVVIPVTYERVGLFCVDSQFQPEEKEETVRYELVRKQGKWKVDGPTPDYPYVGLSAVKDDLSKTISDAKQPPELRAQARRALASIDKLVN